MPNTTTDREYAAHFRSYLRGGPTPEAALETDIEQKGGFAAPPEFVAEVAKGLDNGGWFRRLARVLPPTAAPKVVRPRRTAKAGSVAWGQETSLPATETALKFGSYTLTPHYLTGEVEVARGVTDAPNGEAAVLEEILTAADPAISGIVWDVDSPGGSVAGVAEASDKLLSLRGRKRTVAVSNTLMASAAYWLASAADEIVATPSSLTGSIGIYTVHEDYTQANEKAGVKVSYVAAGKYKVDGHAELTPTARASMQAMVNDYYGQFVAAVAVARRTTPSAVRNGYGEGDTLTAQRAVAARLADRVATLDAVIRDLSGPRGSVGGNGLATSRRGAGADPAARFREARQRHAEAAGKAV